MMGQHLQTLQTESCLLHHQQHHLVSPQNLSNEMMVEFDVLAWSPIVRNFEHSLLRENQWALLFLLTERNRHLQLEFQQLMLLDFHSSPSLQVHQIQHSC
ncbi:hypothetical protein V6Z11_D13G199900 [Gossypium hirsutum]